MYCYFRANEKIMNVKRRLIQLEGDKFVNWPPRPVWKDDVSIVSISSNVKGAEYDNWTGGYCVTSTSIIYQELLIQTLPGEFTWCFSASSLTLCRFAIQARLAFVNVSLLHSVRVEYFLTNERANKPAICSCWIFPDQWKSKQTCNLQDWLCLLLSY